MNVSSPWRAYLQTLYGGQHAYVRPSNVSIIYSTVVPLNLSLDDMFGPLSNDCSGLRHEHQFNQWDVPSTQFVRHRSHASLSPLRSHSWVEVTHCAERVRRRKECSRPSHCLEQTVFFMYVRPGSGVWYNTGRTAAFESHAAAFESCGLTLPPPIAREPNLTASPVASEGDAARLRAREYSTRYYNQQRDFALLHNQLGACLRRRGLTSVQFTGQAAHPRDDRWCDQPVMEIVDLSTTGLGCLGGLELRSGWQGRGPRITQCWNGCAIPPTVCDELRERSLVGRVRPGALCHPSMLRLVVRHSLMPCLQNNSFGCTASGDSVWVAKGCRALFDLGGGQLLSCGKPGMDPEKIRSCSLPRVNSHVGPCREPEREGSNLTLQDVLMWSRQARPQ